VSAISLGSDGRVGECLRWLGTAVSVSDTDTLTPQADLSVSKTDGQTAVAAGTSNTYTLTVTNAGPSAVRSVSLTDAVPAALLNPVFGPPSAGHYDPATVRDSLADKAAAIQPAVNASPPQTATALPRPGQRTDREEEARHRRRQYAEDRHDASTSVHGSQDGGPE